ncbi:MAG: prepilin peptidase [Candidatus Paceibacterota bacterium]|jgi:leader peptidase (prepilin peptidase)/N-methyltransferase
MEYFFYFFVFILGAIIGSFLNVVIYRHNTEMTLLGRSFCFSCNKQLTWRELFPIASFLALRGKCRFCKSKISWQYSIVEAAMGFLSILLFWKLGGFAAFAHEVILGDSVDWLWLFSSMVFLVLLGILLLIAVYDLKHKIIPDTFSYLFAGLAFLKLLFLPGTFPFLLTAWDLFAGVILAAPFALLWLISEGRWMGLGDAKLVLGIGWFLGLGAGFTAVVLAFWIGAIFGVTLILAGKLEKYPLFKSRVSMKSELPFAPFLILGLLLVFFVPSIMETVGTLFLF